MTAGQGRLLHSTHLQRLIIASFQQKGGRSEEDRSVFRVAARVRDRRLKEELGKPECLGCKNPQLVDSSFPTISSQGEGDKIKIFCL